MQTLNTTHRPTPAEMILLLQMIAYLQGTVLVTFKWEQLEWSFAEDPLIYFKSQK